MGPDDVVPRLVVEIAGHFQVGGMYPVAVPQPGEHPRLVESYPLPNTIPEQPEAQVGVRDVLLDYPLVRPPSYTRLCVFLVKFAIRFRLMISYI